KKGFGIEFRELKVADYLIKGIAIERKTSKDFFSSLFDKRLFSQMEEISQYDKKVLIIEGDLIKEKRMHENALRGVLLSISLNYKVPILFSKNEEETAEFLRIIGEKKEKEPSINVSKKNFSKNEELLYVLESFPEIGPAKARKLLKKFGTIKKTINSKERDFIPILGKSSKKFKEILNRKFEEN